MDLSKWRDADGVDIDAYPFDAFRQQEPPCTSVVRNVPSNEERMRTTTITIEIEARADSSESRIKEAVMADLQELWRFGHARATEDGKPVRVRLHVPKITNVEVEEEILHKTQDGTP
jgi:hypothetical protein